MAKILCTNHDDTTPSMELYETGGYCFVCGHFDPVVKDVERIRVIEDLSIKLEYIKTLPIKEIRGLKFPVDNLGYYLVWPDGSYYKQRLFKVYNNTRYLAPSGHFPPIYSYPKKGTHLFVIEGEINAKTIQDIVNPDVSVCSPSSSTNFDKYIYYYLTYDHVSIIVDKDVPGVIAGLKLKKTLMDLKKNVRLIALETDYNDLLQEKGKQALKEVFEENMDM